MSGETLSNYYEVNFAMAQHHHWSIDEIEGMVPFERKLYVDMLSKYLKELKDKQS